MAEMEQLETRQVTTILQDMYELSRFRDNMISSTKYTLVTWLPITLGIQFRRLANIYFLLISTLMMIGTYAPYIFRSPIEPASTISTLLLVLMVTSCKEGYDDIARFEADRVENCRPVTVVTWKTDNDGNKKLVESKKEQQDLTPGDIVKLEGKCRVPCDLLLMYTSNHTEGNTCYVETSNIDGETNLKIKSAPAAVTSSLYTLLKQTEMIGKLTKRTRTIYEPTEELFDGSMEVEMPNNSIYTFVGALHLKAAEYVPELESVPLNADNVLLRASVFSNTDWAYGICIYAGKETKIIQNNRLAPLKMSNLEVYANRAVVCVFCAQFMLVSTSVISLFALGYNDFYEKLPYVYPEEAKDALQPSSSYLPFWLEQWFVFLILFNNFIPISLYVTMELVTLGQTDLISNDKEMYDEELDKCCVVKTGNLVQELGQIGHVFSDKTGTLTRNEMKLVNFTVNNTDVVVDNGIEGAPEELTGTLKGNEALYSFVRCLILCHTVVREQEQDVEVLISVEESGRLEGFLNGISDFGRSFSRRISNSFDMTSFPNLLPFEVPTVPDLSFSAMKRRLSIGTTSTGERASGDSSDSLNLMDMVGITAIRKRLGSSDKEANDAEAKEMAQKKAADNAETERLRLIEVRTKEMEAARREEEARTTAYLQQQYREKMEHEKNERMMMGHLNSPTGAEDLTRGASTFGKPDPVSKPPRGYRAESPDELALVLGTRSFGCQFLDRNNSSVDVEIMGQGRLTFEQLAVNAFDADRKRMSVLMQSQETGEYFLFCKGADTNMLPVLLLESAAERAKLEHNLMRYAVQGLRTLVIAQKKLSAGEATAWLATHAAATTSMQSRSRKLTQCALAIEQGLELLGITAIEDRLQDEVPEVIADLAKAGVILWMLTGDKEETAVNIGKSCNLILPDTNVHNITNVGSSVEFTMRLEEVLNEIKGNKSIFGSIDSYDDDDHPGCMEKVPSVDPDEIELTGVSPGLRLSDVGDVDDMEKGEVVEAAAMSVEKISAELGLLDEEQPVDGYTHWSGGKTYSASLFPKKDTEPAIAVTGQVKPKAVVGGHALVMDGPSFSHFDPKNTTHRHNLIDIGMLCRSVVACRLTPIQKANLVNVVKAYDPSRRNHTKIRTVAIGDGANDVPMIQEADVGVGMFGKEGNQAANQADFAISQFKHLRRLLLVHGRSSYIAQVDVCLYCLHKNMVLTITLFWYSYYTSLSGTSLYESWIYSAFNLALGLPIIFYGILDRDLSQEFVLKHPETYETSRTNSRLSMANMASWFINALAYATALCCMCYIAFINTFRYQAIYVMGTIVWTGLVMSLQGKVIYMSHSFSWPQITCMVISVALMFPYFVMASYGTMAFYKQAGYLFLNFDFWFLGMFTIPVCTVLVVDVLAHSWNVFFNPSREMLFREIELADIFGGTWVEQCSAMTRADVNVHKPEPLSRIESVNNFTAKISSSCDLGGMPMPTADVTTRVLLPNIYRGEGGGSRPGSGDLSGLRGLRQAHQQISTPPLTPRKGSENSDDAQTASKWAVDAAGGGGGSMSEESVFRNRRPVTEKTRATATTTGPSDAPTSP